jgi:uncharacterized protein (DUF2062 family)
MPHRSHPLHTRLRLRRARLKRWLKPLPRRANVDRYPVIRRFADAARRRPWLWSFRHREVMVSLYVGSVLALLPTYGFQLLLGFALAVWLRGNLAVMTALQMVVNPLTIVPIYGATLLLGHAALGAAGVQAGGGDAGKHAIALVVGGVIAGLAFAVVLDLAWRVFAWEARRFRAKWRAMHDAAAKKAERPR